MIKNGKYAKCSSHSHQVCVCMYAFTGELSVPGDPDGFAFLSPPWYLQVAAEEEVCNVHKSFKEYAAHVQNEKKKQEMNMRNTHVHTHMFTCTYTHTQK